MLSKRWLALSLRIVLTRTFAPHRQYGAIIFSPGA